MKFNKTAFLLLILLPSFAFSQTFQNNNFSCEDNAVSGTITDTVEQSSQALDCGRVNSDNSPDCVTLKDTLSIEDNVTSNLLINSTIQENNCFNQGGQKQFENAVDLINEQILYDPNIYLRQGNVALANLNGTDLDDLVTSFAFDPNGQENSRSLQFIPDPGAFLLNGGSYSPTSVHLASDINVFDQPVPYPSNIFEEEAQSLNSLGVQGSFALEDCDEDGFDEAIVAATRTFAAGSFVGYTVLDNTGAGLIPGVENDFVNIELGPLDPEESSRTSLALGKFNPDDDFVDMVLTVDLQSHNDRAILCLGDANCQFNCDSENFFDLNEQAPSSVAAGDFNYDGLNDVAIAKANGEIHYLFNVPDSHLSNWDERVVSLDNSLGGVPVPIVAKSGAFSVFAKQNRGHELAITVSNFENEGSIFTGNQEEASVQVILSDAQGPLAQPELLRFSPNSPRSASGLSVLDADACGGDDILALSQNIENNTLNRFASYFPNDNLGDGLVLKIAPSNASIKINEALTLNGSCEDPTGDDRNYAILIEDAPLGSLVSLSNESGQLVGPEINFSTIFQADTPGDYTLKLTCNDICGATMKQFVLIHLKDEPSNDVSSPEEPSLVTQGGCIASLASHANAPYQLVPKRTLLGVLLFFGILFYRSKLV